MLFKKWHPAGSISKKLLTVKDLMITGKNKLPLSDYKNLNIKVTTQADLKMAEFVLSNGALVRE